MPKANYLRESERDSHEDKQSRLETPQIQMSLLEIRRQHWNNTEQKRKVIKFL